MDRTDQEMERDWVPNGRRPQSTIARSFSQELMDIFKIDDSLADLDNKVDQRKQQVNTQTSELEALERRIKEMEERLKKKQPTQGQAGQAPVTSRLGAPAAAAAEKRTTGTSSRPGTAKQTQQAPAHGGAMPPTPTASEGEYELVDKSSNAHGDNGGVETRSFTDLVVVSKDGEDRDS